MYQERCWDFFPAGDCFRKQYEDQLGQSGRLLPARIYVKETYKYNPESRPSVATGRLPQNKTQELFFKYKNKQGVGVKANLVTYNKTDL